MAGYWEIWDVRSRNVLAGAKAEQEALAIVRDIVGEGSTYSDLLLMFDDPDLDIESLPTPTTGVELERRAVSPARDRLGLTPASGRNMAD